MIQEVPKFHETFNSILEILADREIIHTREMQKRVIEKYYSHLPKELLEEKIDGNFDIGIRIASEEEPKFEFYTSRLGIGYRDIVPFYKSRIKDKINELILNIDQQLDKRFRQELQETRSRLENSYSESNIIPDLKIKITSFEESITYLKDFNLFGKEIIRLTETLPENIVVASASMTIDSREEDIESLNVPLRRITRFYIDSRFIEYPAYLPISGFI